jgi:hypothetical protein
VRRKELLEQLSGTTPDARRKKAGAAAFRQEGETAFDAARRRTEQRSRAYEAEQRAAALLGSDPGGVYPLKRLMRRLGRR